MTERAIARGDVVVVRNRNDLWAVWATEGADIYVRAIECGTVLLRVRASLCSRVEGCSAEWPEGEPN